MNKTSLFYPFLCLPAIGKSPVQLNRAFAQIQIQLKNLPESRQTKIYLPCLFAVLVGKVPAH